MDIGKRIAAARKEAALSQEGLARHAGCTTAAIRAWERGGRYPRKENLDRLAEVLGRPVSWFFEESDPAADHRSAA